LKRGVKIYEETQIRNTVRRWVERVEETGI
jgi:hypothetical protein